MSNHPLRLLAFVVVAGVIATASQAVAGVADAASSDAQIAKQGALVATDFPVEWTSAPSKSSSDSATEKVAATIPDCRPYLAFGKSVKSVPRAKSPDFDLGNSSISNTVSVFTNAKRAEAALSVYASAKTEACINKLFGKLVATRGVTFTTQIESVDVGLGDQSVGHAGTITATSAGDADETFGVGLFVIRTGRGVAMYSYFSDTDETTVFSNAINTSMTRFYDALA